MSMKMKGNLGMGRKGAWLAASAVALTMLGAGAACAQATDYTTYYKYDAQRRPVMKIGPAVNGVRRVEQTVYDPDGQVSELDVGTATGVSVAANGVITVTGLDLPAGQKTVLTYDGAGNPTQVYANAGTDAATLTQTRYDAQDRPICVAVRMNAGLFGALYGETKTPDACQRRTDGGQGPDRIVQTTYDPVGQVKRVDQAVGTDDVRAYARYEYTDNGKQREIVDANGDKTTLAYDGFDRLQQQTFPSPTRPNPGEIGVSNGADYEAYGYDANSNRTSLRKRDGNTLYYCYDVLNRPTIKRPSSGVTTCATTGGADDDVFTSYDLAGAVKSVRFKSPDTGSGVSYGYDTAGRLTSETTFGRTVGFELDNVGNRTKVTWPEGGGAYATSGYDAANHLSSIGPNGGARIDFTYDGLGRRTLDSRSGGAWTTRYCYDAANRPTHWAGRLANGELLASETCDTIKAKAVAGFLTQGGANADQAEFFAYNPANQVMSRALANSVYSWNGTAVSQTVTADGLNRDMGLTILNGGGCAASGKAYDCNGNLTNDGRQTFVYDRENRLVSAPGASASLAYDPLGRLYQTTIGTTVTQFLYDGDQLIAEYDVKTINNAPVATLLRRYLHGPGTDDPLIWFEGADFGAPRYLRADRQGSIVGWSDASGVSQAIYTYGPYGEPGDNWGAGSRFRYTGQIALPELKLYHYKARAYDPARGWFLQTDPIGYKDDLNLYAYVGDDPVNRSDPTGLICHSKTGSCDVFDERTKKDPASAAAVQARYNAIYGWATKNPNAKITVKTNVNGKTSTVTVTGKQISTALESTNVTIGDKANILTSRGGVHHENYPALGGVTVKYSDGKMVAGNGAEYRTSFSNNAARGAYDPAFDGKIDMKTAVSHEIAWSVPGFRQIIEADKYWGGGNDAQNALGTTYAPPAPGSFAAQLNARVFGK